MICTNCNNNFEINEIETKLYNSLGLKTIKTELCYSCKGKNRYQEVNNFSFKKVSCKECNKEVITGNISKEDRPLICMDCYYKLLGKKVLTKE